MFLLINPMYYVFMIPGLIFAAIATFYTKSTFNKFSRRAASSGMTGAQAASHMLHRQGICDVKIEPVRGFLSDHYDPSSRTLRLSPSVYGSQSLSAIGVACHEAGHALQHAAGYAALTMRTALVPLAQVGSSSAYIFLLLGTFFSSVAMFKIGAIVLSVAVLFSIVTLPVEWNASARAKQLMVSSGIVGRAEAVSAGQVLNAAFLTYVAGAVTAILQLLYFLMRAGLLGGGDD